MARQGIRCPMPHDFATNRPQLRISLLVPSPTSRPLLDLFGISDQELQEQMAKSHPYAFYNGSGKTISYQNYKEAARALMERNMPEILHNIQTMGVFLPETDLPTIPRVVDLNAYEAKKRRLSDEELAFLKMKRGSEDITNAIGVIAEKDLAEELQKIYAKNKVVILQGGIFRVPCKEGEGAIQEHDFVIIDMEYKLIICIESKVTLTGSTAHSAVQWTKKLPRLLSDYFASEFTSGQWCFVPMVFTERVNTKQPICLECLPFIIQGTSQLATKMNGLQTQVQKVRPQRVVPSHAEYVSLVQGLTFVVPSQPSSTHCIITSKVHDKVVGKPARGNSKAKAGQGDFASIIFWSLKQAKIMLTDQKFVFFASPWGTGKTLCMREKAVMWATQNPTLKLFFVVAQHAASKLTSLLEMELKTFFHQQHNLQNVEVLRLKTSPEETLSSLLKEATTWPPGSWMVDELIMPEPSKHQQWAKELQQLKRHIEAQTGNPHLWIAMAGIENGKAEHFEQYYLTTLLPPVFHLPEMEIPLRTTKQVLAMAHLEGNTHVKDLGLIGAQPVSTNPVYKVPDQLINGVKGRRFVFNDKYDNEELTSVTEAACKEVFRRTGGAGFPVLCDTFHNSQISFVKRGVERSGCTALIYQRNKQTECCSEAEVEEWLRRRRNGEEKRCLITDGHSYRGWEASHTLVISLSGSGYENLVMRTVGYCAVVVPKNYSERPEEAIQAGLENLKNHSKTTLQQEVFSFIKSNVDVDAVRVSERTVCDPFLKHATIGYVVTWLRLVTT